MTRFSRILITDNSSAKATSAAAAAPPPKALPLESDFVIILAVLICALICVVGLIAAARCAWRRRNGGGGSATRYPSQPASANKGVLQSLPKFTYISKTITATATTTTLREKTDNSSGDSVKLAPPLVAECAICLGEFVEGDEIRVLPRCGHSFHVACIDKWLGSHSTCPSCRQILVVGRCQKCGQFPAVSLPTAAETIAGSEAEPQQLNSNTEYRFSTITNNNSSNNNNAFLA